MTPPDQERLDAISEALARLLRHQDDLESRLQRLESAAGFEDQWTAPSPVHPPPLPHAEALPPPVVVLPAPPPMPEPVPTPALETQVGLNWINRVAVVTLIFGAAFFFKYAVDNDWIGPAARVGLGVVAAMISLFFGDRMWRRGHAIFAQGLMGFGIALLYLSFYASFTLYGLLPQSAAFSLMTLTTVAAALMGLQYDSQAIAILGLLGGYLTPVLLSTGEDHPWILFGYVFLLNVGGLALTRARRWESTEYLSLVATVFLYSGWFVNWFGDGNRTAAITFAIAFYAQFAVAETRAIAFVAQLLAAIAAAVIEEKPPELLFLTLIFSAGGLAVAEFRRWEETPPWTLFCFWLPWLPYGIWVVNSLGSIDRELTFGLSTLAFAIFLLWVLWWAVLCRRAVRSTDLAMLVGNAAAYFAASYQLLDAAHHDYMGLFAVALALVHLGAAKLLSNREEREPSLLAVAVTLAFLTLAIPIQFTGFRITIAWALQATALAWLAARYRNEKLNVASWLVFTLVLVRLFGLDAWISESAFGARFVTFTVSAIGLWLAARFARSDLPAGVPYVAGHFVMLWNLGMEVIGWAERSASPVDLRSIETTAISILMALYALMLVILGVSTGTAINRVLGLGLMGAVVAKLYLNDIWQISRIFRITAFLALGILLLLVSYLYSRFKPVIERLWKDEVKS